MTPKLWDPRVDFMPPTEPVKLALQHAAILARRRTARRPTVSISQRTLEWGFSQWIEI
ncbi:hypothetical protein MULP_03578 [Mycobacterium liflandii 128FXT]|uniref:Uncharacterized protein n=1 Tax=Mycobacterium liflandii (strain 128FXT) TaxID=459424 RepID=L7VCU2_MYCL1|nr:hypothetical protein MULP_03578 [Mycobacterium liflandii 128FXT]